MAVHEGVKYSCEFCEHVVSTRDAKNRHIRTKHKDKVAIVPNKSKINVF